MPELNPIPTPAYQMTSTHNADTFTPRGHMYNDPQGLHGRAKQSTIGMQSPAGQAYHLKAALTEAAKKRKFGKLADVTTMPKNQGQRLTQWHYFPLLDDRNLNDQGIDARGVQIRNGNLYGSSNDIGVVTGRLPVLTEVGGRVNRVGFSRTMIEGTFNQFGFFYEWTRDFVDFDSDPQALTRMYTEAIIAAEQIQEDLIQIDLLNGAGTLLYSGTALTDADMDATSVVDYQTIKRLEVTLDELQAPKNTKIISGSRMIDTRTLRTSRILFVPREVVPFIETMRDNLGRPAFIPVQMYAAAAGEVMEDEIGSIGSFRIVECSEMKHWAGAGGAEDPAQGLRATNGKYDVFPMLCVPSEAFTTIGFQTAGKKKFEIITKHPSRETADFNDPYGRLGFTSVQWNYGMMIQRPEWIGLIKTVAPI